MESPLYNSIYQRVSSEVNNDEQFCTYLAEICTDSDSHCDDLRDIIDTMFKTSYPTMSDARRQHVIYSLLDIIEENRKKSNEETDDNVNEEDDIDLSERVERDGECKLCGSNQRITSRKYEKGFFS